MTIKKTLVIGSGPAGLMAAATAARNGSEVTLFERMNKPGVKLLASGGAKCNITNALDKAAFMQAFGREGRFMAPALDRFFREELFAFFQQRGLRFTAKDSFHYFPVTENSRDVVKVLTDECSRCGVNLLCDTTITELKTEGNKIIGTADENGVFYPADAVIIAGGGCAWPGLGGSSRSMKLAESIGHTIAAPYPAMAPLMIRDSWVPELTGISLPDAALEFHPNKHTVLKTRGELLFTHKGLSGPCAIDLAGNIAETTAKHGPAPLKLSINAKRSAADWKAVFGDWRKEYGRKEVATVLAYELPSRLADILCGLAECRSTKICMLTSVQTDRLSDLLSGTMLAVAGAGPMDCAMAMKGGVRLKEIDPETMESRLVKGLYFAGEVMDLVGPCGGYNIQWALSSGYTAGMNAGSVHK